MVGSRINDLLALLPLVGYSRPRQGKNPANRTLHHAHHHGSTTSTSSSTTSPPRRRRHLAQFMSLFFFSACISNYVWISRQQYKGGEEVVQQDLPTTKTTNADDADGLQGLAGKSKRQKERLAARFRDYGQQIQQYQTTVKALEEKKENVASTSLRNRNSNFKDALRKKSFHKFVVVAPNPNAKTKTKRNLQTSARRSTTTATGKATVTKPPSKPAPTPRLVPHAIPVDDPDPSTLLSWAPSRIKGYIHDKDAQNTRVLFGHVLREFTHRIMARPGGGAMQEASQVVVVVSPEAPAVVELLQQQRASSLSLSSLMSIQEEGALRRKIDHAVGGCTLIHAHKQGHGYHGWNATSTITSTELENDKQQQLQLLMMDHGFMNDHLIHTNVMIQNLLQQQSPPPPRYIVVGIGAYPNGMVYGEHAVHALLEQQYKVMMLSLSHVPFASFRRSLVKPNALLNYDTTPKVFEVLRVVSQMVLMPIRGFVFATQGLDLAIPTAMEYQPQIGHGSEGVEYKTCPTTGLSLRFYSPVLEQAMQMVYQNYTANNQRQTSQNDKPQKQQQPYSLHCQNQRIAGPAVYNYAPVSKTASQQEREQTRNLWFSGTNFSTSEALCLRAECALDDGDDKNNKAKAKLQTVCATRILVPSKYGGVTKSEQQVPPQDNKEPSSKDKAGKARARIGAWERRLLEWKWQDSEQHERELHSVDLGAQVQLREQPTEGWNDDGKDNSNDSIPHEEDDEQNNQGAGENNYNYNNINKDRSKRVNKSLSNVRSTKPNLLVLMVESISRPRFERSLVKTNRALQRLNFTSFPRYTAIANGSAWNQAALFSGKTEESQHDGGNSKQQEWLWDTLQGQGYATLKAADACVDPYSEVIPSTSVDHGQAFREMMCFDFQRPNCLGERSAAQHLLAYGVHFMKAYDALQQPWAAFLQFVDAKEDTQTLEGTLDEFLWKFLHAIYKGRDCDDGSETKPTTQTKSTKKSKKGPVPCSVWDNTMIMVMSDQGIDYGSYVLSPQGLKERSMPVLQMHLPQKQLRSTASDVLQSNRQRWTTPLDAYETILDVLLPEVSKTATKADEVGRVGASLLQPFPEGRDSCKTTPGLPPSVCEVLRNDSTANFVMPNPPSIMSYYADVPRANKDPRPLCDAKPSNASIDTSTGCICATNSKPWYPCIKHPWAYPSRETLGESFSMVDCGGKHNRSFEIQVQRDPAILERPEVVKNKAASISSRPNILFVEMDSVSTAYAERHLPLTRELLDSIRLQRSTTNPNEFTCGGNDTLCAVEFEEVSVVGPSSIPNQVAVFGACFVSVGPEVCSALEVDAHNRTICTNTTSPEYGMELVSQLRTSATFCRVDEANRSPWIFDIAKSSGYVTLFAEDFCYDGSVYVPQGNLFPLNADITPATFFCRVLELKALHGNFKMDEKPLWQYAYHPGTGSPGCVDADGGYEGGLVSLHHVESMWDSYNDTPKFAYINSIAAHQYKDFGLMADDAETYDILLSSFLKRMLSRADATNTIIVVRADHGLQAGPATPDYSIQVEALRPWTEVIVPKTLGDVSLSRLDENRQSLVTGFDFYKTLTTNIVENDKELMQEPPSWSFHLWDETIPKTRTCADAQVRADYCLYESHRTYTAPNLRSCNLVEDDQRLVCPPFADAFQEKMSAAVTNAFDTSELQEKVCPASNSDLTTGQPFLDGWKAINTMTKLNKIEKDPIPPRRQASILGTLISQLGKDVQQAENRQLNICQTGFGGGHTTSMFLDASRHVRAHVFDPMDRTAQPLILELLRDRYGQNRINHIDGDSCETVPRLLSPREGGDKYISCDVLYGGNPYSCDTDNMDLVQNAPCGVLLTSMASKSLLDRQLYFNANSQWRRLQRKECIRDVTCFADKTQKPYMKFCMAITTGKCQLNKKLRQDNCDSKIAQITKRLVLGNICPAHKIAIPEVKKIASQHVASVKNLVRPTG